MATEVEEAMQGRERKRERQEDGMESGEAGVKGG